MTRLTKVYRHFFSIITDDLCVNYSKEEVEADCESLLLSSINLFEYPKQSLSLVEDELTGNYVGIVSDLTLEELNILASGMARIWLQREVNSIDLIRQRYSSAEFKLTSQQAHLYGLEESLKAAKVRHRELQTIYSKRREVDGKYVTNFDQLYTRY